ncbi:voltage-gated potassium channel Kch [Lipingzhangella halophila]|uniref:Voltage-gated potassium channel Kch n=1 Tax=Lipingzhangella halophila TaxID=1783352 RepID=A0A7W7W2Q2_9ACTN|nr:potassium channel family protein [Lipingzhangella halophila]MBB4932187.1 voltage-gated potassium channel Kch [Lipingzhangella halophila]
MRRRWNLGFFLLALLLLQFGFPMTFYGPWWTGLYMLLYAAMVVFGILVTHGERDRLAPALLVTPVFLAFGVWVAFDQANTDARLGMLASLGVFQLVLMHSLVRAMFRSRGAPRGLNLVAAAVCVYLLIGGVFASLFGAMEILRPGSFADTTHPDSHLAWQQLTYFSYVTQATLGYGDVVPVSPWARSLASFQAMTGTIFLATVIARLVGGLVPRPEESDGETEG